jgi:hypothetical protein
MCAATPRSTNSPSTVIPRVVLEDLALRLHRLGARRVRDVAVREGATLALLRAKGNARGESYSHEQGA